MMLSSDTQSPTLAGLAFVPYINEQGELPQQFAGNVGIYAIFNQEQVLTYVGYSRDILLSLKQHLIRCPQQCYWVKAYTIDRPKRSLLEEIRDAWIVENGTTPPGNGAESDRWTQPVDAKHQLTPDEQAALDATVSDLEYSKTLKKIARRVESEIAAYLGDRGLAEPIRFDPKLKEQGLLSVKP